MLEGSLDPNGFVIGTMLGSNCCPIGVYTLGAGRGYSGWHEVARKDWRKPITDQVYLMVVCRKPQGSWGCLIVDLTCDNTDPTHIVTTYLPYRLNSYKDPERAIAQQGTHPFEGSVLKKKYHWSTVLSTQEIQRAIQDLANVSVQHAVCDPC